TGWSMLAFDHSKAWIASGWPLPSAPIPRSIVTVKNFAFLDRYLGGLLDTQEFRKVLDHIRDVPASYIQKVLDYQADGWLSQEKCDDIMRYWQSPAMGRRLNRIEEGLSNGEYV
ncbi:MAG: hypothetical protein AAFQ00_06570, partial [Pseudomonadota bacterium]